LVGGPEEKRQPGRTEHSWKDNINRILQKQGERCGFVSSVSGFLPDAGLCKTFSI